MRRPRKGPRPRSRCSKWPVNSAPMLARLRDKHPRLAAGERAEGRRYMVTVHAMPEGARLVAVKGDPTAVLPLCASRSETGEHRTMDEAARAGIEADNLAMAEAGLRVLGIAYRLVTAGEETGASAADLTW